MSLARCMEAMARAAGRPLSDDEMLRVAERLERRVNELRRARGSLSDVELYREASGQLRQEAEREAALRRRSAFIQAQRDAGLRGIAAQWADPRLFLEAVLVGVNTPGAQNRFSIDYRGKAIFKDALGAFLTRLETADPDGTLVRAFRRGSEDADVARELWAMPGGRLANGYTGVTGNDAALGIARAMHETSEAMRLRQNRAGAWIDALPGWIVRQTHDGAKLRRARFEQWRDFIRPLLDDRTFERRQSRLDDLENARAGAETDIVAIEADIDIITRAVLRPFAERVRQALAVNERAAAQQDALRTTGNLAAEAVDPADTTRGRAGAIAGEGEARSAAASATARTDGDRPRAIFNKGQMEALAKLQRRLERMAETGDEAQLRLLRDKIGRDVARIARRLDDSARAALDAGPVVDTVLMRLTELDDRLRAARARSRAATDGLHDLRGAGDVHVGPNGPQTTDMFLRAVYDDIVSGRINTVGHDGHHVSGVGGAGNLAMSVSAERVLHFTDADAFMNYQARFGRGNLSEAFGHGLERGSRNTAVLETLGPNPGAGFDRLRDWLIERNHGDPRMAERLRERSLDRQFAWITGAAQQTENMTRAQIGAIARGFMVITRLGGMVISSFADTATVAAEARYQGRGYLSGYAAGFDALLHGRGGGERRAIATRLGAGLEGFTGAIGLRLGAHDDLPGLMSKAVKLFYTLNLGSWWTDSFKRGVTMMTTHHWGEMRATAFDALEASDRSLFAQYGIDGRMWDLARTFGAAQENGRWHIVPGELRELGPDQVRTVYAGLSDLQARRMVDDVGDRFATFLADRADYAVVTPGAREQAMLYGGHPPGSWWGEALRFFWQFKQFPTSFLSKAVGRELYGRESRSAAWGGFVSMFLQTTAMGYLAMSAKDLLKGREPRDPLSWQTWLAAGVQGGGAGIYGDFLFGDYTRFGKTPLETVPGPAFGVAADIGTMFAKAIRGEFKAADAVRFGASMIPAANLFYLKPLFDYGITYRIQESLNPGYLRRMESRIEQQNNQRFWLPPSEVVR